MKAPRAPTRRRDPTLRKAVTLAWAAAPGVVSVWGALLSPPYAALAAPAIPNPGIESRFDVGVGTVTSPSRPQYDTTAQGNALRGAQSAYSAIVGRARWLVPLETDGVTFSGGLYLSLHAGFSSLDLTAARGPDGRYFSEYGFLARAEWDLDPFLLATGLSMSATRSDYTELSVRTVEPSVSVEARGTFRSFEVYLPTLSPEVQIEGRAAPALASYQVKEQDAVTPRNGPDAPFSAKKQGSLTAWAVEVAAGVRYAAPESKPGSPVREGVVALGASYARRTYAKFLLESRRGNQREDDVQGEVLSYFLTLQGFLP